MTASVLNEDVQACFRAGVDDFMPKPFSIEQVQNMLLKWCDLVWLSSLHSGLHSGVCTAASSTQAKISLGPCLLKLDAHSRHV